MTAHGKVQLALPKGNEVILVEDVRYRPRRWSWEVQDVMEGSLNQLPADLSPITERWLQAARVSI
jgi:hypothetical protein